MEGSDAQHDPNQIPSLIEPLQRGDTDIVIGSRNLGQMPFYRRIGRCVLDYNQTGYFSIPFTILAGFFLVLGVFAIFTGMILNIISRLVKKVNGG